MYSEDDVQYALENTKVLVSPERRIETFGATSFHFYLVTELMDRANEIRVRDGRIQADRPQILTAENIAKLTLEGFGEKARKFAEMLRTRNAAMLKYGFQIRKDDLSERLVHDSIEAVLDRVESGPGGVAEFKCRNLWRRRGLGDLSAEVYGRNDSTVGWWEYSGFPSQRYYLASRPPHE